MEDKAPPKTRGGGTTSSPRKKKINGATAASSSSSTPAPRLLNRVSSSHKKKHTQDQGDNNASSPPTTPREDINNNTNTNQVDALIASKDWSATPLGARSNWPWSLRVAAELCVHTQFPSCIVWGQDETCIYNEVLNSRFFFLKLCSIFFPLSRALAFLFFFFLSHPCVTLNNN